MSIKNRDLASKGYNHGDDVEPMEEELDVTRVAILMNKMGFLQQKLSVEQDE